MSDMEVWKPVPGYEGFYSVSDLGRVRSESRTVTFIDGRSRRWPESIRKTAKLSSGHLSVWLYKNHKPERCYVHRLVLEAFVGEAPPGTHGCHWNDDPGDNRLENLRWGTSSENRLDSVRNGGHNQARKTHCKWGHEFTPENTLLQSGNRGRKCRTCENARRRAKARGVTLEKYLKTEDGK